MRETWQLHGMAQQKTVWGQKDYKKMMSICDRTLTTLAWLQAPKIKNTGVLGLQCLVTRKRRIVYIALQKSGQKTRYVDSTQSRDIERAQSQRWRLRAHRPNIKQNRNDLTIETSRRHSSTNSPRAPHEAGAVLGELLREPKRPLRRSTRQLSKPRKLGNGAGRGRHRVGGVI